MTLSIERDLGRVSVNRRRAKYQGSKCLFVRKLSPEHTDEHMANRLLYLATKVVDNNGGLLTLSA